MPGSAYIDFTWSGGTITLPSFTVGGTTFPYTTQADGISRSTDANYEYKKVSTGSVITFTASATLSGVSIVTYRWDFGDGTIGYGPTATHTYLIPSQNTQVSLVATDNFSQTWTRSKTIGLRYGKPILVPGYKVYPS